MVAYEDEKCLEFHHFLKALRRDLSLPDAILLHSSVRGTGNFVKEVPVLLRTPCRETKQPPDCLVCIADADRPGNLVPDCPSHPRQSSTADLDQWVRRFENTWRDHLIDRCPIAAADAARLRTGCLRWNKESLLIAVPEALVAFGSSNESAVRDLLRDCKPNPDGVRESEYSTTFQKPGECMNRVVRAISERGYKKGRDDDDILRDQIRNSPARRAQVRARCSDLDHIVQLLQ